MQVPVISVYNQAKTPLDTPLEQLVPALQAYIDQYVGPAWGVACKLQITPGPVPGTWGFVLLDNADVEGALAYHTDEGLPLAKVFVETTKQAAETLSSTASHELAEMLVDPGCNLHAMAPNGTLYCLEVADAVEETSFMVAGLPMSDFCLPAYFGEPAAAKFDYCGELTAPFTLAKGGYATTVAAGQMGQIFGSDAKTARFLAEDRRGRRSARRMGRIDIGIGVSFKVPL